jgi:hypothetical protein
MENKLDLNKELPELYCFPDKSFGIVEVPLLKYPMIDGKLRGHHEIYLGDFRKMAPRTLKTVLRQPFII